MECIFCHHILATQILTETDHFKVVFDIDPIQKGHMLILSKAHIMDLRELSAQQVIELWELEKNIITICEESLVVDGMSVIQNNGVMDEGTHFHVHLVPRYINDHFWESHTVVERDVSLRVLRDGLRGI